MSIERLFDAVERRGDIGRRVAALVLPISDRPRVTSRCAGKIDLREPGEHTSGPNLTSRDNVAHNQNLYTILETPPPVIPLCRKQARTYAIMFGVMRDGAGCGAEVELRHLLPHPHQACSDVDR
jgi:hypothetical protein